MIEENAGMTEDELNAKSELDMLAVGAGLMRMAEEQIGIRQVIEDRWLADLEQYLGKYDAQTLARLEKQGGSKAFVNGTRAKTAAAESRLSEMLFPTDDKNWGIKPTPVPSLMQFGYDIDEQQEKELKESIEEEAREKCNKMMTEIDDQLSEANYQDVCRQVIHDACLFGTGVIKAPVIMNRTRKSWQKIDGTNESVYAVTIEDEYRPGVEHVKIWDFFPDMSATDIDDAQFVFERRFVSRKQLIELSKRPGYIRSSIERVLRNERSEQNASGSSYIAKLRELSNLSVDINKGKYEMWEYHGPLDVDDMRTCGCDVDDDEVMEQKEVVVVFIGSNIIKIDENPMETGERPYSTFIYERDDSSIFGMGVPFLVRNEQRIMNAAWRMVIDNAGLSTGPQVIINRENIVPADGNWKLAPRKEWFVRDPDVDVRSAFATFEIPSHQNELSAIYSQAKQMMDDVTNLPLLAQGEIGNAPDTATGMSMIMNSANTVLRRVVKNFDDNITVPVITRFYDWNMQFNDKDEIKGDFEVSARGSSTLLVKETQTQALMGLLQIASSPVFMDITKIPALYRKAVQAQHLVADEIVKTDEEIEAEQKAMAEQSQGMHQQDDADVKIAIAQLDAQTKLQIAQMKAEADLQIAQLKAEVDSGKTQLQEDNKANLFMAEKQIKETMGSGI